MSDKLFAAFDADGNGLVNHTELLAGLSVLCSGSQREKIRTVFDLYGTAGLVCFRSSVLQPLLLLRPGKR